MTHTKNIHDVPAVIDEIGNFLVKYSIMPIDITRCKLLMEEAVLAYRDKCGCDVFSLELSKHFGKATVSLEFSCDSYAILNDKEDMIVRNLVDGLLCDCKWEYKNGVNHVTCEFDIARSMIENLLYLRKFIKGEKVRFSIACSMQVASILFSIIVPILSSQLISNFALSNIAAIVITALILFGVRVVNNLLIYFANRLHNAVYTKIRYSIEMELTNALMSMNVDCIEKHGTGMIIQRMTSDTVSLSSGVESLVNRISDFINYIGTLIAIAFLCPAVFVVKLVSIALLIFIQAIKSRTQTANDRAYRTQNDRFSDLVGEMVRGSKDIKLLHSEKPFVDEFETVINETNKRHLNLWNTSQNYTIAANEGKEILELCYYVVLALYLSSGHLQPTEAIVLFNYSSNLSGMPAFVGNFINYIKNIALSSERVYQLVNNHEFGKEVFGTKHLDTVAGNIEFQNVTFAYDAHDPVHKSKNVLSGLNMNIRAGEIVAFVGKSGCGKTTALNLISKLYTPTSGSILLDDVDISLLDKDSIRNNIAVVSQNPYVFNMSIRDNLRLIKPDLTDEQMYAVCRDACIHDDILHFPNGYDTVLGEGGVMISGGQRQRLALARCMLKDASIILFDEATSALDNVTQARIQETIKRFSHKKTIIIVAHRLSTIKICDRIFYFDGGRVLAQGSHEGLLESCPEYRELYTTE